MSSELEMCYYTQPSVEPSSNILIRHHLVLKQFNGYHLVESLLSSEKGVLVSVLWFSSHLV